MTAWMLLYIGDEKCVIFIRTKTEWVVDSIKMLHLMQVWVGIRSREEVKSTPFLFSLSLSVYF